jgi:hypothetical protein
MSATVAAISQLVATGAIDQELTQSPTVTYFRYQHFRHTNFALENQLLQFNGNQNVGQTKATCQLHRSGDLVNRIYVVIDLPGIANAGKVTETFAGGTSTFEEDTGCEIIEEGDDALENYKKGTALLNGQAIVDSSKTASWCNSVGFRLIKQAVLQIGSQAIDTLYSDFLFMYHELSKKPQKSIAEMIGGFEREAENIRRSKFARRLHVPLPFFCTKTTGSSLPIVSLQFHTVSIVIDWNDIWTCVVNGAKVAKVAINTENNQTAGKVSYLTIVRSGEENVKDSVVGGMLATYGDGHVPTSTALAASDVTVQLECMYVYLDLAERSKFSSGSFQLLMSEVAENTNQSSVSQANVELSLDFNHAVIELLFAVRKSSAAAVHDWFDYSGVPEPVTGLKLDPVKSVRLTLNNSDRFYTNNTGSYFRTVQPYQHHSNIPSAFVYSYSFALFPESENPSGQANFSRIDTKKMHLTLDKNIFNHPTSDPVPTAEVIVYARNWNLLRVTLGLAGKAYAN